MHKQLFRLTTEKPCCLFKATVFNNLKFVKMSECIKPNVQPEELNIASTPEQAVNAATTEFIEQNSIEEETPQVQTEDIDAAGVNENSKPATRQEIVDRLKAIAESGDVLNCKAEVESLKILFYRLRTAELEIAHIRGAIN